MMEGCKVVVGSASIRIVVVVDFVVVVGGVGSSRDGSVSRGVGDSIVPDAVSQHLSSVFQEAAVKQNMLPNEEEGVPASQLQPHHREGKKDVESMKKDLLEQFQEVKQQG